MSGATEGDISCPAFSAVVYDGVRYPVANDVADAVIGKIGSFEMNTDSDFIAIVTTCYVNLTSNYLFYQQLSRR